MAELCANGVGKFLRGDACGFDHAPCALDERSAEGAGHVAQHAGLVFLGAGWGRIEFVGDLVGAFDEGRCLGLIAGNRLYDVLDLLAGGEARGDLRGDGRGHLDLSGVVRCAGGFGEGHEEVCGHTALAGQVVDSRAGIRGAAARLINDQLFDGITGKAVVCHCRPQQGKPPGFPVGWADAL